MAENYKPDNAAIKKLRAKLASKKLTERRSAVTRGTASRKPAKPSSKELWSKVWQRINAERATGAALELETNTAATSTAPTSAADRLRLARKRGMKEGL